MPSPAPISFACRPLCPQVGVMAQLSSTLAQADISLLAQSSFDTDYIFVKEANKAAATKALEASGCTVAPL